MRGFLITSAVLSLSFYAPAAQAQESEFEGLDRAYCDDLEFGHPDLERCEVFLEELAAEEELLNQMVAASRSIAAETTDRSDNSSRAIVGGFVVGAPIGGVIGLWFCPLGSDYIFGCADSGFLGMAFGFGVVFSISEIVVQRSSSGGDTQVSVSPYRQDDASGLMFSGQF